ncbi:MAG: hypothetical protein GWN62_23445, partial [Aliifodinibius sp.]|nr:hypothetical protein [Fodinibius sp.]
MTNSIKLFILLLLSFLIVAITINYGQIQQAMNSRQQNTNSLNSDTTTPMYNYRIVNIFPHDDGAYTQGLVYDEGVL